MKIVRNILFVILILIGSLCAFILFCMVRPDIAKALSERLNKNAAKTLSSADAPSPLSGDDAADLPVEVPMSDYEGINPAKDISYSVSEDIPLTVPDEYKDRNGYEEIEAEEKGITDPEADEIETTLSPGNTGDGLEFDSMMYPYYNMLDDVNQHLYRQIYANACDLNKSFSLCEKAGQKRLRSAFTAVVCDHPELFWLNTAYSCLSRPDGSIVSMELSFNRTADDLDNARAEFDANAEEILGPARNLPSDYEKETYIHDALIDRIDYDLSAEMNQSAYSALVNDRTVCAGYARAFQYLCSSLGIPAYYCAGNAGEPHAWNIVGLEDGYYNVDSTWDDTAGHEYDYYNKSDSYFAPTHRRRELSVYLPPCEGGAFSDLEENSVIEEEPENEAEAEGDHLIVSSYEEGLKDLSDYGKTEDDLVYDMNEYYAKTKNEIESRGIGSYEFDIALKGRDLVSALRESNANGAYKEAYLQDALINIGAKNCLINMEIEELKNGNFIVKHTVDIK